MEFLASLSGHSSILKAVELEYLFVNVQDEDDGEDDGGDVGEVDRDIEAWKKALELPPMPRDALGLKYFRESDLPFSHCCLGLHHLTHLELSRANVHPHHFLDLMSVNPMLKVVILRGTPYALDDPFQTTNLFFLHLNRMELYKTLVHQILSALTFPPGTPVLQLSPKI